MNDPDEIWVVIDSTGAVAAYDTRDAAINATRDTDDDIWIERATIQGSRKPSKGARSAERATGGHPDPDAPNAHAGAQPLRVPTSLGATAFYNPWSGGGDAA
jgi:hypothetical protein